MKPNPLWFRAKNYGYGWVPYAWQGWLVTAVAAGLIIVIALTKEPNTIEFYLPLLIVVSLLIYICNKTGEEPRWRWGKDKVEESEF